MLKDMKLGTKMGFGFGLIILMVLAIAVTGVILLLQIQSDAIRLNQGHVPETRIAIEIERNSLLTMYNMRGYSLSLDDNFYSQSTVFLQNVRNSLQQASELSSDQDYLVKLAADVVTATDAVNEYSQLALRTDTVIKDLQVIRQEMEQRGEAYIAAAEAYLQNQYRSFTQDVENGAGSAALNERMRKINLINQAIDHGNEARILNYRAQATRIYGTLDTAMERLDEVTDLMDQLFGITDSQSNVASLNTLNSARENYSLSLQEARDAFRELANLNSQRETSANRVLDAAQSTSNAGTTGAQNIAQVTEDRVQFTVTAVIVGLSVAILVAVVIAVLLTRSITSALIKGVRFAEEIAQGNLDITLDLNQKDEVGQLADSMRRMLRELQKKAELIAAVANGDLTIHFEKASEKDGLGESLQRMRQSLNEILTQVDNAVEQVTSGAGQVSQASQSLSQGASEQASSMEEIGSSITQINQQAQQNSQSASQASHLARKASEGAAEGNAEMGNLRAAMQEINDSSGEIRKVVKVIDDIAFQINLLALNANVEAARAGKYGKGFAVVAEEVRNLAVRSGEAVQETTSMVDQSLSSIEKGNVSVRKTADRLEQIVKGVSDVESVLLEIASASGEQAQGIGQVTEALDQIDSVTQSNTASAEESASAAEELAGQAEQLKGMLQLFKLDNGHNQTIKALPQE